MAAAGALTTLESIAVDDARLTVRRTLDAAREMLGMDIAYFSEFSAGNQVVRDVRGDSDSFGFSAGTAVPLEETYCRRMVAGTLDHVIPDTRADERVRDMPATRDADIGSYVGVPLRLSDGRVYGTLCCVSHEPKHALDDRDVRFMRVLARLLADQLERTGAVRTPGAWMDPDDEAVARLSIWFAGAANAAPASRQALSGIEEHLDEGRRGDLRLLVTELVTNAVRHTGIGPRNAVGLDVRVYEKRLRVDVTDPGRGFDPEDVPDPEPGQQGGWGLYLVEQLADRWGAQRGDLMRVWFEMDR